MAENFSVDPAGAKQAAADLQTAGDEIGNLQSKLVEARADNENQEWSGTDETSKNLWDNYKPLADNLTQVVAQYYDILAGKDGLPAVLADAVDKLGKVDQASGDGFNAAANVLEA